ncbi:hypothetical protein [Eupransor demetentiae]|uniref:Uncharacterized protein n=1 Tax=Eupransor demetentiae TaxID=3109584 RepID=A0ABM9N7B4_9LACO|nr:hypothetical protein R54876_GBNLAHCA_01420 [Lactobacillaceae bacterium LMG 33000]
MFSIAFWHILPGSSNTTHVANSNNAPLANVGAFILRLFGK